MKTSRIFWNGFCVALVTCAIVVGYLAYPRQVVQAKANNLVGTWDSKIIVSQGTYSALITVMEDGTILVDKVPVPFETTAHGNWISLEENKASYTFLAIVGRVDQTEIGKIKVIGTFQYDLKTDSINGPIKMIQSVPNQPDAVLIPSIRGPYEASQTDSQGNMTYTAEGTITGTRIQ